MIEKAIILAAGLGNRISAVAHDTPKPLLPLDGQRGSDCFLDWHLRALTAAGVREIYVVGNKITCGTRLNAGAPTWILNPTDDLSTSGSAHSAHLAFTSEHRILDGRSRVVLMDADIIYDPSLFALLAADEGPSKTLVASDYRDTNEEVLVFGDGDHPSAEGGGAPRSGSGKPRVHGKGLLRTPMVEGLTCLGEATGILLFEPRDHEALLAVSEWVMRYSTAKLRSEHEDVTQRMMDLRRMRAVGFGKERAFMEVDTPDEYRVLVEEVYPALIGRGR